LGAAIALGEKLFTGGLTGVTLRGLGFANPIFIDVPAGLAGNGAPGALGTPIGEGVSTTDDAPTDGILAEGPITPADGTPRID